jgi:hypothetical protein
LLEAVHRHGDLERLEARSLLSFPLGEGGVGQQVEQREA